MKRRRVALLVASASLLGILLVVALAYAPWPVRFFPTLKEPINAYPLALYRGRLVVEGGCVRIRSLFPTYGFLAGPSSLVVWPYGYSVAVEGVRTVIRDGDGKVVARVGDFVRSGGGEIPRDGVEELTGAPLPDRCHGPFAFLHSLTIE